MITYKLTKQEVFNFLREDDVLDKMKLLEEKITQVIIKLKSLSDENSVLNSRVQELNEELGKKDEQIISFKKELEIANKLKENIDKLNSERDAVKSQIEGLIGELESIEL